VLLVHGFASSFERNWREPGWVDLLSEAGRQVIGVDLLGHGSADKPYEPEAYADLHEDVAAALPADPALAVDAIGFSLGAVQVLRVAAASPERFRRIVVAGIAGNVLTPARDGNATLAGAVEAGPTDDAHGVVRLFAQFAQSAGNDPKALAACLRRPTAPLTPAELGRVTCPVLVVLGADDFAGAPDALLDALPDARLVTLPGVDHFRTPEAFGFIDAALDFLDAVPA
jgi:pimeloyl-ACP methyl ester carboxylesterase